MNTYAKRLLTAVVLGALIALLDMVFVAPYHPIAWNLSSTTFWQLFISRTLIGFFVGIVGVVTEHPVLTFVHMRYLRGIGIGILLSLGLATGLLAATGAWSFFWQVVVSGAIYGLIIDAVATKVAGDGKKLVSYEH